MSRLATSRCFYSGSLSFLKEKNHLKIRKKKFPGTKFLGTFGPPPNEKTEKIGKIKGTLVRKVPGNLRSQEFDFFLVRFFCALSLGNGLRLGISSLEHGNAQENSLQNPALWKSLFDSNLVE